MIWFLSFIAMKCHNTCPKVTFIYRTFSRTPSFFHYPKSELDGAITPSSQNFIASLLARRTHETQDVATCHRDLFARQMLFESPLSAIPISLTLGVKSQSSWPEGRWLEIVLDVFKIKGRICVYQSMSDQENRNYCKSWWQSGLFRELVTQEKPHEMAFFPEGWSSDGVSAGPEKYKVLLQAWGIFKLCYFCLGKLCSLYFCHFHTERMLATVTLARPWRQTVGVRRKPHVQKRLV